MTTSKQIGFDQIAEVSCRDCEWFGMKDELTTNGTRRCPECKSSDLQFEDED